jgi:hypothetical protein
MDSAVPKVWNGCARNLLRMQKEIRWSALADDFRTFLLNADIRFSNFSNPISLN